MYTRVMICWGNRELPSMGARVTIQGWWPNFWMDALAPGPLKISLGGKALSFYDDR